MDEPTATMRDLIGAPAERLRAWLERQEKFTDLVGFLYYRSNLIADVKSVLDQCDPAKVEARIRAELLNCHWLENEELAARLAAAVCQETADA